MGRDPLLGRVHLLLGRQNLYYISLLVNMGRQIVFYNVLWVANYQLLRTTGLDPWIRSKLYTFSLLSDSTIDKKINLDRTQILDQIGILLFIS